MRLPQHAAMAAMNVHPRHHRLDLRQIDVIIGVYLQLIAGSWRLSASGANIGKLFADIRGFRQLASNSRPAFAWFLRFLRLVCFLALRGR